MILDIARVLTSRNSHEEITVECDLESIHMSSGDYPIREKKPFEFHLANEENRRLQMEADTSLQVAIPCDRCLTEVAVSIPVHIEETVPLEEGVIVLQEHEEDAYPFLSGTHSIDCDKLVFDEVLVNWPSKVLCRADCKGLCPVCGQNLNLADCGHDGHVPDPRMAGIQDIFKNFKEV